MRAICLLLLVLALAGEMAIAGPENVDYPTNALPKEVDDALRAAKTVELFSLQPPYARWFNQKLDGFRVVGKIWLDPADSAIAAKEFRDVVHRWRGESAECFNPRVALRVKAQGATYDMILCYECKAMEVCRNGKWLADLGAVGDPRLLDGMLTRAHVPLAKME